MYVVVQTSPYDPEGMKVYGPWETWQEAAGFAEMQRAEGFSDSHVEEVRSKDSKPYC